MRQPINDEFKDLPISRQRKYQLRKERDGFCTECGKPATIGARCLEPVIKARERERKQRGYKRRNLNSLAYKMTGESF